MNRRNRWRSLGLAAVMLGGSLAPGAVSANHIRDRALLPDLGMAPLQDFSLQRRRGTVYLRFDAIIVNVGEGPFQALGHTRQSDGELLVDQQFLTIAADGSESWSSAATNYDMYWSGDDHSHWHVRDLEEYRLENVNPSDAPVLRTGAKHGFCFYDNYRYDLTLPDAPSGEEYTSCGSSPANTQVTMGLSIGWGDIYQSTLRDQYIDITGLPAGTYQITAKADAGDQFAELDENNNTTTAVIKITKKGVEVVNPGTGP